MQETRHEKLHSPHMLQHVTNASMHYTYKQLHNQYLLTYSMEQSLS